MKEDLKKLLDSIDIGPCFPVDYHKDFSEHLKEGDIITIATMPNVFQAGKIQEIDGMITIELLTVTPAPATSEQSSLQAASPALSHPHPQSAMEPDR